MFTFNFLRAEQESIGNRIQPFFHLTGFSLPFPSSLEAACPGPLSLTCAERESCSHPGCVWVSGSEAVKTRCIHLHHRSAGNPTCKNGSSSKQHFAKRQTTESLKQKWEHSIPCLDGMIHLLRFGAVLCLLLACSLSSICHTMSSSHTAPMSPCISFSCAHSLYTLLFISIIMLGTSQTI